MRLRVAPLGLALMLATAAAAAQTEPASPPPAAEPKVAEEADGETTKEEVPSPDAEPFDVSIPDDDEDTSKTPEAETAPEEEGTGFPRVRLVWRNLFAGRLNPLGLIDRFNLGWRIQILDKPGKIYKDSQASFMLHTAISPAFTHIGGRVELQPLTILRLGVTFAFMGSHAAFDFVQPFDDPEAEFDDKTLDDRADLNTATIGYYVEPGALVQAAVGPVAVRNEIKGYHRSVRDVPDNSYFWDPSLDILFPNNGWALTNDADLLFLFDFGLTIGGRYTLTHTFYDDDVDLEGPAGDNVTTHRAGPVVLYKFYEDDPPTAFNAPIVGVLAQWWAAHRYRTGNAPAGGLEDRSVSQAMPYLLLFFSAKGDFYPTKPAVPESE